VDDPIARTTAPRLAPRRRLQSNGAAEPYPDRRGAGCGSRPGNGGEPEPVPASRPGWRRPGITCSCAGRPGRNVPPARACLTSPPGGSRRGRRAPHQPPLTPRAFSRWADGVGGRVASTVAHVDFAAYTSPVRGAFAADSSVAQLRCGPDKGKPAARRGRKAMGLGPPRSPGCRRTGWDPTVASGRARAGVSARAFVVEAAAPVARRSVRLSDVRRLPAVPREQGADRRRRLGPPGPGCGGGTVMAAPPG